MGLFAPARMAARVSGWDRQDAGVVARETASGALVAGTVGPGATSSQWRTRAGCLAWILALRSLLDNGLALLTSSLLNVAVSAAFRTPATLALGGSVSSLSPPVVVATTVSGSLLAG